MSGRVRWQRDGKTVIGHRKTDRRQTPARPIRDCLDDLNRKALAGSAVGAPQDVRMAFRLPQSLKGFVASGAHGVGVNVVTGDFVQIKGYSAEQCFSLARRFFADVAKDRPAFTTMASLMSNREPDRSYGRWLVVVQGALVACAGNTEPKVFEAP